MTYTNALIQLAADDLRQLCVDIPTRSVGSAGNQRAVAWFAETIARSGFTTEMPTFTCMDWHGTEAAIDVGGVIYHASPSPYALGCDTTAPLVVINTADELEQTATAGRVVLLRGAIAAEQLMPKSFTFYNPDEHQRIYRLLDQQPPAAIICATGRDPNMAGGVYPFPLFEDGDFDRPSVYLRDVDGDALAAHAGQPVRVISRCERRSSVGANVYARRPGSDSDRRFVIMAHIDAKAGTPGALDNAAGVTVLLLLAELLKTVPLRHTVEIVAINGEDYYANPGELDFMRRNDGVWPSIALGINLDGVGYIDGQTAYSLYECPDATAAAVRRACGQFSGVVEGESWVQGDHMMLIMNGIPTVALTSEKVFDLLTDVIHTERDTPAIVDPSRLVTAAQAVAAVLQLVDTLP